MPAKSEAQRKYLYATKGADWVRKHGFDNKGELRARVKAKRKRAKRKRIKPKKAK